MIRRLVPLAGGHNFRDLGGYPTRDGRQVATGRLFRSGTLSDLTDDDHVTLAPYGIRFVCDLRTSHERGRRPTRWPGAAAPAIWARDYDHSDGELARVAASPAPGGGAARAMMADFYRRMPWEQADAYRELLVRIAGGQVPAVFHCSAGKDRTGVIAAILLDLLGVTRDMVIADYLATEAHYPRLRAMVQADDRVFGAEAIDLDRFDPMLRAETDYLAAMFAAIDARAGSTMAYVRDGLGLDDGHLERLRANLLV